MNIARRNELFNICFELFGVCFAVNILESFFVEALKPNFKLNRAFRGGTENFYGFFVKYVPGNLEMETDVFGYPFSVLGDDESPKILCTLLVRVKGSVNELYGLRSAFGEGKHLALRPFNIEKAHPAAPPGKAKRAGIGAATARLKVGDSSPKRVEVFLTVWGGRLALSDLGLAPDNFASVSEKNAGNIEISIAGNGGAKRRKGIFSLAGDNEVAPIIK